MANFDATEPVVILGFGQMGQVLANFLSTPLASGLDGDKVARPYVAFDLNPGVVKEARKSGFPILYGDGSRPAVLQSAGISSPKAVMIMYTGKGRTIEAVQRIRLAFPAVPIYARAQDLAHLLDLKKAGATDAIIENAETSLQLGSKLLKGLGVMSDDVSFLRQLVRDSMELQALEALTRTEDRENDFMKPLQVRVTDMVQGGGGNAVKSANELSLSLKRPEMSQVLTIPEENQLSDEPENFESDDGVKYCRLDTNNGSSSTEEDVGKIDMSDSTVPFAGKSEGS